MISQFEKNQINHLIKELNDFSQDNALLLLPASQIQDKIKSIDQKTKNISERGSKLKNAQNWLAHNQYNFKNFLNKFEMQYADKLMDCDESLALKVSKLKWQMLKKIKKINEVS